MGGSLFCSPVSCPFSCCSYYLHYRSTSLEFRRSCSAQVGVCVCVCVSVSEAFSLSSFPVEPLLKRAREEPAVRGHQPFFFGNASKDRGDACVPAGV